MNAAIKVKEIVPQVAKHVRHRPMTHPRHWGMVLVDSTLLDDFVSLATELLPALAGHSGEGTTRNGPSIGESRHHGSKRPLY